MAFAWTPTFHRYSAEARQTSMIYAGVEEPMYAEVSIGYKDFMLPAGTKFSITFSKVGQADQVFHFVTPKDVIYVPTNPAAGNIQIPFKWTPPVAGRYQVDTRNDAGVVIDRMTKTVRE